MLTKQSLVDSLSGEIISKETIDLVFSNLENQLLDKKEISYDFQKITFISVYFLERLENLINKAKELSVKIQILNVQPAIYKVFQVARTKSILEIC